MLDTCGSNSKKTPEIMFDIDDDIEEISFNLADKGLGFHHKERLDSDVVTGNNKISNFEINKQLLSSKKNISPIDLPRTNTGNTLPGLEMSLDKKVTREVDESILESLNENNNGKEAIGVESPVKKSSVEKVAFSWLVDVVLILFLIGLSITLFFTLTGIPYNDVLSLVGSREVLFFFSIFFSLFYLFYFSILDLTGSPGKLLFGTKVISKNKDRLKLHQTFLRSFIILTSPLFLFLPLVFGLHDSFSKTSSVEVVW